MKPSRRIIAMMLVLSIFLTVLPVSALAAFSYEPLKLNTWYSLKENSDDMTAYKLKVSTDTVFTVNWKDYETGNYSAHVYISADKSFNNIIDHLIGSGAPSSGSDSVVLYPGTYYILMYDGNSKTKVKITKKSVKSINKPNYCLSRVITLSKNKKEEFAQTKKEHYTRWYKIKLTKSQVISIYGYNNGFTLYDSNFNSIRCDGENGIITTDGKQHKGTYYLVFYDNYFSDLFKMGKYYKIYWK